MPEVLLPEQTAEAEEVQVAARWELVECTCPDWCERDHERD